MILSVQDKIAQLLWDKRYVYLPAEIAYFVRLVIIKDPTLQDQNYYLAIKQSELAQAIDAGVPTENEVLNAAKIGDFWTESDDEILQETDAYLAVLEQQLQNQKLTSRKKQIQIRIDAAKTRRAEVENKLNHLKAQTAEYMAHEAAVFSLMRRIVLDFDETPLWKNEQDFLRDKQHNPALIYFLAKNILGAITWPEKEIREVAKNPEWRMTWVLNREHLSEIFNKNIGELNINQKMLIYWSRIYDSAFEATERPEMDVIQDDEKFDRWLLNREDIKKETKLPSSNHNENAQILEGEFIEECVCGIGPQKNIGLGLKQKHAPNCQYGYFRKYTPAEKEELAKRIYERNSRNVRTIMAQEQNKIEQEGWLEEQTLRKKKTREILGAKTNIIPVKR